MGTEFQNLDQTQAMLLEGLMDKLGLQQLLFGLSEICHAKAEHIESAWQDRRLAEVYTRIAIHLETAGSDI
jgi:hypothetical protein